VKYAFVIAGTQTGAGKTTAALVLLGALHAKAMIVQPFKVGPDYLDPGYHNLFSGGRKSRNLDNYLLSEETIRGIFERNLARADVGIVEGMMGLFDGSDDLGHGCTAEIAKILGLPVILILDAQGMSRSAGAHVMGFRQFDPGLNLKGVIFNQVCGDSHYESLKNSIPPGLGLEILGYIPFDKDIRIPEKHLGLASALEHPLEHSFFDKLAHASRFIDLEKLLSLAAFDREIKIPERTKPVRKSDPVKIGIAYDEAFSFYYEDNFDLLLEAGAELVFFSPLYTDHLPRGLDALYIGGGFPENFASRLSRNLAMMEHISRFVREGHLIYAECGGFIYLSEKFRDASGECYPMVGLLPGDVEMTGHLQSFGYKQVETCADTFLFSKGQTLRSHEFHYSRWNCSRGDFESPYRISGKPEGFWRYPVLASYQHLHFGACPDLAKNFVRSVEAKKTGNAEGILKS